MPDQTLQVPMKETATVTVGEELTINFTSQCCFCCDPDQVNFFNPPLPIGDHNVGDSWTGRALQSGTVKFSHKPYGQECGENGAPATSGRSIIVGG
jgi:hypothetical protein